jgi:hypothetical protein
MKSHLAFSPHRGHFSPHKPFGAKGSPPASPTSLLETPNNGEVKKEGGLGECDRMGCRESQRVIFTEQTKGSKHILSEAIKGWVSREEPCCCSPESGEGNNGVTSNQSKQFRQLPRYPLHLTGEIKRIDLHLRFVTL